MLEPASRPEPADGVSVHRLHVSTLWLPVLETIRTSFVPVVVGCFFATPIVVLPGFVFLVLLPTFLGFLIRYRTVYFWMTDEELVIQSGWLSHRERRIPWRKVQEFELQQGILRRPFELTRLKLNTAGSDAEEASLDVITVEQAEAIRLAGQSRVAQTPKDMPDDKIACSPNADFECKLTIRDLVLGGLTSNLITGAFAIVGVVLYFGVLGSWGSWFGMERWESRINDNPGMQRVEAVSERFEEMMPRWGPLDPVIEFVFTETFFKSLALAVLGLLFSVGAFVTRYYGFTFTRNGERLHVIRGLFTRNEHSLERSRIQSLKLEEGLLRRWFGLVSVSVDSAGDRQRVEEQKKRDVLLPIAPREVAFEVAEQSIAGFVARTTPWCQVSRLAIGRGTRKGSLLVLGGILQAAVWSIWFAVSLLPGFLFVYLLNRKWYQHTGYCLTDRYLLFRKGWLNRSTLCLPISNIQNVKLARSPFDRRLGLATLSIDTAGQSNTGGGPVIRHLAVGDAVRIRNKLMNQIAESRFHW